MIELTVEKMKCGGCSANVERAVKAQDPTAQVQIDLALKLVQVESTLPTASLAKIISDAGYPAHVKA
ncbi:MAG: heavy-metal-associated domain-containing protein [Gammaproteobacteria bacterium]|uniref:heavy-metal-associated domain-containing protein n=1 Tax=Limnobacter sp. TaxID=2003368 RepID=UPI001D5DC894|nr:heavy-metal-associated domain-containing protein [Gammaproteobacteria bacterium]MBU0850115.1 heavy-metal-associated domain-containing protein [Gammaproteobacteria bacterium]MBU1268603.1 heavy-metal-associated domain-containing protein [Gammaproteobacteria bacterium]MBU1530028.1 heavy-metal-associated domain-containing protein [Gammaproteobacteria bacterium]MBU1780914.1 heavy-metal-associated domain-containing protein [Gammaproteobacteria bacterium]